MPKIASAKYLPNGIFWLMRIFPRTKSRIRQGSSVSCILHTTGLHTYKNWEYLQPTSTHCDGYKHLKATRTNAVGEKSSVKSGLFNKGAPVKGGRHHFFDIFNYSYPVLTIILHSIHWENLTHFWPPPTLSLHCRRHLCTDPICFYFIFIWCQ